MHFAYTVSVTCAHPTSIKMAKTAGTLTEDGLRDLEQAVQKLTDRFVGSIDEQVRHKEAEVMEV